MNEIIDQIEITFERLKNYIPEKKRLYYQHIKIDEIRGVLIYGLRGVGKTTFLIDKVSKLKRNFLYFSADNPAISSFPLYDLVSAIFKKGYDGVVIDEIHHANKWSQHVKALYDDYPGNFIWISDSSNLILRKAIADLSRRFIQIRIPLMSFREYLYLSEDILLEKVDIFNEKDLKKIFIKLKNINILKLFSEYIRGGIRPIFFEGEYCKRLEALMEKSIYYDIPFYVSSIQDNHLRVMKAIIGHLITSPIPRINISGMCSEWDLGKEKLYNLLYVMEHSELINIIRKSGKYNTKGAKIFLSDPSVYYCYNGNIGNAREAFVVMCLKERYNKIYASKDERDCDFIINDIKIEVGGSSKQKKNSDFIISDDIDVPVKNKIPMWMLGLIF